MCLTLTNLILLLPRTWLCYHFPSIFLQVDSQLLSVLIIVNSYMFLICKTGDDFSASDWTFRFTGMQSLVSVQWFCFCFVYLHFKIYFLLKFLYCNTGCTHTCKHSYSQAYCSWLADQSVLKHIYTQAVDIDKSEGIFVKTLIHTVIFILFLH